MKRNFYLFFCIIFFSSCKSIIINRIIKDAKVENTKSIQEFQLKNKFDTSNSFIAQADTTTAMSWLTKGISGYEIFNNKGESIDFIGSTTCGGSVFQFFLEGKLDSFKVNKTNTLQKVLDICYNYQNKKIAIQNLPQTDYYVVVYWAKFMGRKFGYKQAVSFMEDDIKEDTLKKHSITLLKINTDLQESWGIQPHKKMKVKLKIKKEEAEFIFGELPIKK
jgi:hypothetical protein